jgi:hypothetical protein
VLRLFMRRASGSVIKNFALCENSAYRGRGKGRSQEACGKDSADRAFSVHTKRFFDKRFRP